jgi:hypothetical protein
VSGVAAIDEVYRRRVAASVPAASAEGAEQPFSLVQQSSMGFMSGEYGGR